MTQVYTDDTQSPAELSLADRIDWDNYCAQLADADKLPGHDAILPKTLRRGNASKYDGRSRDLKKLIAAHQADRRIIDEIIARGRRNETNAYLAYQTLHAAYKEVADQLLTEKDKTARLHDEIADRDALENLRDTFLGAIFKLTGKEIVSIERKTIKLSPAKGEDPAYVKDGYVITWKDELDVEYALHAAGPKLIVALPDIEYPMVFDLDAKTGLNPYQWLTLQATFRHIFGEDNIANIQPLSVERLFEPRKDRSHEHTPFPPLNYLDELAPGYNKFNPEVVRPIGKIATRGFLSEERELPYHPRSITTNE